MNSAMCDRGEGKSCREAMVMPEYWCDFCKRRESANSEQGLTCMDCPRPYGADELDDEQAKLGKESNMETPVITRKRAVLSLISKPDGDDVPKKYRLDTAVFSGESGVAVHMQAERFEELDFPQELTIAIYPGDRQDLMEQEDFPA